MAGIDYGCVVFKNGKRYKQDELYPIIDELNINFYKTFVEDSDDSNNNYYEFYGEKWFVHEVDFKNVHIKAKKICPSVYTATIRHDGDRYNIIFGYGIDNDIHIWNKIKFLYLGKTNAKKVDKWFRKMGIEI